MMNLPQTNVDLDSRVLDAVRTLGPVFNLTASDLKKRPVPRAVVTDKNPKEGLDGYVADREIFRFWPDSTGRYSVGHHVGQWLHRIVRPPLTSPVNFTDDEFGKARFSYTNVVYHYAGLTYNREVDPVITARQLLQGSRHGEQMDWSQIRISSSDLAIRVFRVAEIFYRIEPLEHFQHLVRLDVKEACDYIRRITGSDLTK